MCSTFLLIGAICLASLCVPLNGLPNHEPVLSSELVDVRCNTDEHCLTFFGKHTNHTVCKNNSCLCYDSEDHRITCKPDVSALFKSYCFFFLTKFT